MTTPNELEEARLRRGFVAASEGASPRADCPVPDRLVAAVRRELASGETRAIVAHTAVCPSCAEDWRVLRDAAADEPAARGGRTVWYAAVAAAAALLVVAGVSLWRSDSQPPSYREGPATEGVVRSLLDDGQALPRAELVLRWSPGPAGATYDVEIAGADLTLLHRATGLEAPELRVPSAAVANLAPGARLLWRVDVVLPDGRRLSSPTFVNAVK